MGKADLIRERPGAKGICEGLRVPGNAGQMIQKQLLPAIFGAVPQIDGHRHSPFFIIVIAFFESKRLKLLKFYKIITLYW